MVQFQTMINTTRTDVQEIKRTLAALRDNETNKAGGEDGAADTLSGGQR